MYDADNRDRVIELKDAPLPCIGAPLPIVLAGEHDVLLAYLTENDSEPDGTARIVDSGSKERIAGLRFIGCYAHMFGPPNDESIAGHPLYDRGLNPYGAFEVLESSWIRRLEKMNSVHPYHDRHRFLANKRHLVFSFHDSTFECIAAGLEVETATCSMKAMVRRMAESIEP